MAGNAGSRQARRLSVRAATEPLPSPLPPPPRPSRSVAAPEYELRVSDFHAVPPQPHFVTRFPTIDSAQFQSEKTEEAGPEQSAALPDPAAEQPVAERSLASPGVIVALAACVAVMCAIGWYEKHGVEGFKWDAIKIFVQRWSIEPADPDEDLRFITAIPLTPNPRGTESIAQEEAPQTKKTDQVVLSDQLKDDDAGTSDDDRTQLR